MPALTPALRQEYDHLFETCRVRPEHAHAVNGLSGRIVEKRPIYGAIEALSAIPWYAVGLIHAMESAPPLSMSGHLHNGDPLSGRTVRVPAGRPEAGAPPFTWEESALDALERGGLTRWTDWSVAGLLFVLERFNGWGYRKHHPHVLTPYLWSFTNHYTRGKYVGDGRFSATARSRQCGAAALLRNLVDGGLVAPPAKRAPKIQFRQGASRDVKALQSFLNNVLDCSVVVDGRPGTRTSTALWRAVGNYLIGDPRAATAG